MSRHHVVYGAGAVGGVVGGLLHRAGHRVTLIARGEHLDALRARGLHLVTPHLDETLDIPCVEGPEELDLTGEEVVHVAVKSDATASVLGRLHAAAPSTTAVVCLQNGVHNERAALRWFGTVLGVCVMLPATHLAPGEVSAGSEGVPAILDIGRVPALPDGGVDPLAAEVAADYTSAGIVSEPRADIMAWKHRKLVMNLANAVDAACPPGEEAAELARRLRVEGEEVLAAAGIEVVPAETDRKRRGDLLRTSQRGPGSSTYQSLARRTGSIEVDWLNGEVVSLAHGLGRRAPVNDLLRRVANGLVHGEPRSVDAGELLARLDREGLDG